MLGLRGSDLVILPHCDLNGHDGWLRAGWQRVCYLRPTAKPAPMGGK